jgi:hypothetical protein
MATFTREQTVQAIAVLEALLNYPTLLGKSGLCLYTIMSLRHTYNWPQLDLEVMHSFISANIHTVNEITTEYYPWISPKGEWTPARKQLTTNVIAALRDLYIGS